MCQWCACARLRVRVKSCTVQAVVSEVFGLPLEWGGDHQELRQLTRGAQQVRHRLRKLLGQRSCHQVQHEAHLLMPFPLGNRTSTLCTVLDLRMKLGRPAAKGLHASASDAQEAAEAEQAEVPGTGDLPVPKAKGGVKGSKLKKALRALASRLLEEQQSELSEHSADGGE